jgi:photosystem II stability/assembly factor-like uncharacterized protein
MKISLSVLICFAASIGVAAQSQDSNQATQRVNESASQLESSQQIAVFPFKPTERLNGTPGAGGAPDEEKEEGEGAENGRIQQRAEWFYRQRAYPHRFVPAGAHQRAMQELNQRLAVEASLSVRPGLASLTTPTWTLAGPNPINTPYGASVVSGRVSALAIDPSNTSILYLGGAQGGIWKSTNGGTSWTPLTDGQPSLAIGSITLDPANPSTIYVGTGEENFSGDSYYGAGVLKSTDGGSTWAQICGPFCGPLSGDSYYGGGARIGGLAIDPGNSQIILAATALVFKDGVYRSGDGGNTWTQVLSGNPGTAVMFDPNHAGVAYSALGNSFSGATEGVYKSTDSGQTWTAINGTGTSALPLTNAGRIVLAMAPSNTTILFASIGNVNDGTLLGLFKTTDGGAHWSQLTKAPDYCTPQCNYDNAIAVQPTNANVVYAGGAFTTSLARSLDGGSSWTVVQSAQNNGSIHADLHSLVFTPDGATLYLGNDGGAYSTKQITASTPTFTQLNTTLALTQFYPGLSIHPTNINIAIGGTQDNGTVLYSGTGAWNEVACGDGGYTAIDSSTPSTMYATCQQVNILKSTSSGAFGSWNSAQSGIDTGDRVDFIPPLVMDPSRGNTLYFGTYRLYATTNGAESWSAISPDLTNGPSFWGVITAVAVAPTDSNTVYAGTGDSNVQVTTNALAGPGATWNNRSSGLPARVLTSLAVDPTISTTAYVTFSGFTGFGDSLGHIFKTVNGGSTWTDISSNLPNTPVNSVVLYPQAPKILFAGTDVGVFYTSNGGTSWNTLINGLPRVAVLGLTLHTATHALRASTHGRGVWDLNTSSLVAVATTTPLKSTPNPSTAGQAVTFKATVAAASGPTPTGTVGFYHFGTLLGAGTLSGGVATFTTSTLPQGTVHIHAVYVGNSTDAASTSATTAQVVLFTTKTTLTSTPNPSTVGQAVTFKAMVAAAAGATPTGTVDFYHFATLLGAGTLSGGIATFTTSKLPQGTVHIHAVYVGSSTDETSSSATIAQVVNP